MRSLLAASLDPDADNRRRSELQLKQVRLCVPPAFACVHTDTALEPRLVLLHLLDAVPARRVARPMRMPLPRPYPLI